VVYGLFLCGISKNNCRAGGFEHLFFVKFAKRLKFAQTNHIMCGDNYYSLVVQHAVAQFCLTGNGAFRFNLNTLTN
jgi:hypothetical protein